MADVDRSAVAHDPLQELRRLHEDAVRRADELGKVVDELRCKEIDEGGERCIKPRGHASLHLGSWKPHRGAPQWGTLTP